METITMDHGGGGEKTSQLINELFLSCFLSKALRKQGDSSIVDISCNSLAVTTDSFVVNPIFFPKGDIGRLSICGTVNDLAVSGAKPLYVTAAFILEEGFHIKELKKVVESMAMAGQEAGIEIIAGDTKVVEKGRAHKIYINTTGIGAFLPGFYKVSPEKIASGDKVVVSGTIGDHGMCIFNERIKFSPNEIYSDVAPVNSLTEAILKKCNLVKAMRDPTRGGIATVLNEFVNQSGHSITLYEDKIPIKPEIKDISQIMGMDPLYMACEGKVVVVVDKNYSDEILKVMRTHPLGKNAEIIGEVMDEDKNPLNKPTLYLKTMSSGTRIIPPLAGEILPRIC